jgi:hypothetical protein
VTRAFRRSLVSAGFCKTATEAGVTGDFRYEGGGECAEEPVWLCDATDIGAACAPVPSLFLAFRCSRAVAGKRARRAPTRGRPPTWATTPTPEAKT